MPIGIVLVCVTINRIDTNIKWINGLQNNQPTDDVYSLI
jgi:hypothetical protein